MLRLVKLLSEVVVRALCTPRDLLLETISYCVKDRLAVCFRKTRLGPRGASWMPGSG